MKFTTTAEELSNALTLALCVADRKEPVGVLRNVRLTTVKGKGKNVSAALHVDGASMSWCGRTTIDASDVEAGTVGLPLAYTAAIVETLDLSDEVSIEVTETSALLRASSGGLWHIPLYGDMGLFPPHPALPVDATQHEVDPVALSDGLAKVGYSAADSDRSPQFAAVHIMGTKLGSADFFRSRADFRLRCRHHGCGWRQFQLCIRAQKFVAHRVFGPHRCQWWFGNISLLGRQHAWINFRLSAALVSRQPAGNLLGTRQGGLVDLFQRDTHGVILLGHRRIYRPVRHRIPVILLFRQLAAA